MGVSESTQVYTVNNETMLRQGRDALPLTQALYVKSLRLTAEENVHGHCILLRRTFPTGPEILVCIVRMNNLIMFGSSLLNMSCG